MSRRHARRLHRDSEGSEELYDRNTDSHECGSLIVPAKWGIALQAVIKRLASRNPENDAGEPDLVDDRVRK